MYVSSYPKREMYESLNVENWRIPIFKIISSAPLIWVRKRRQTRFWHSRSPKNSPNKFFGRSNSPRSRVKQLQKAIMFVYKMWYFERENEPLRTGQNQGFYVEERTFFLGYAILGNVSFSTRKLRKLFLDTKSVFTTWKQRFLFAKLNSQQCFYSWPLISHSPNWQRAFVTVSSQDTVEKIQ